MVDASQKSWVETERLLKGQRTGQRMLLQRAGVAIVKFRYKGDHISAELLDAAGNPVREITPKEADNLRHIAASQLNANPGGAELWHRSAGVMEWLVDGDVTIARRNYPGSEHDLVMGEDLREVAARASNLAEDQSEPEAERPRMYA